MLAFRLLYGIIFFVALAIGGNALAADNYGGVLTPDNHLQSLNIDDKIQVDCSTVTASNPFVLMGIGQSLIANQNGTHAWSQVLYRNVYETWGGKCYRANAPLFGATGGEQSFVMPLANMIALATNRNVVIIMAAIGNTPAEEFLPGKVAGNLIAYQLANAKKLGIKPSVILYEQGQADDDRTKPADYFKSLSGIIESLRQQVGDVPVFVATDTMVSWVSHPDIAHQQKAITKIDGVFAGPDIDLIRYRLNGTHLDTRGLQMQAVMWFQVLASHFAW